MKTCTKCLKTKKLECFPKRLSSKDGHRAQCKDCRNAVMKAYANSPNGKAAGSKAKTKYAKNAPMKRYLSNKAWRERNPERCKAHGIVAYAIKMKRLTKKPCEECGNKKVQAHHDDYSKPLDVRWLCSTHHSQWHRDNGEGKNP